MRLIVFVSMFAASAVLACSGGSSNCSIAEGTTIAVSRANGTGACPASVVAGVTSLNGVEVFTPQKTLSCGVDHFTLTVNFFNAGVTPQDSCQSSDAISFQSLEPDGGAGSDTMTITCASGVSCTETFDVTFAPQ